MRSEDLKIETATSVENAGENYTPKFGTPSLFIVPTKATGLGA